MAERSSREQVNVLFLRYIVGFNPFCSKEKISLVMGYIVDLTLILCGIFGSHSNVTPNGVQSVIDDFAGSTHKASIHSEILSFIDGVPQFEYGDNDVVTAKIRDLISRNCDPPSAVPTYT